MSPKEIMDYFSTVKPAGQEEQAIKQYIMPHWTSHSHDDLSPTVGFPPDHDPANEKVRSVKVSGDSAWVETTHSGEESPKYNEYHLIREEGTWRIESEKLFYTDENKVAIAPDALKSWMSKAIPKADLPPVNKGDEPNCEILFQQGRLMKGSLMSKPDTIRVLEVGEVNFPSGVIVVRDPSYSQVDALPLSFAVKPGAYRVEVSLLERRNAAVRVVFDPGNQGPFHYRKAVDTSGDNMVGVDAGTVMIADALAFMSGTIREHERDVDSCFQSILKRQPSELDATLLSLAKSRTFNAVAVGSGMGDGGYPAFWVFDSQDRLVSLVVDFQVAAEFLTRSIRIPWKRGMKGVIYDDTKSNGPRVSTDGKSEIIIAGSDVRSVQWIDAHGIRIPGEAPPSWNDGNKQGYSADIAKLDHMVSALEIVICTGFRNSR